MNQPAAIGILAFGARSPGGLNASHAAVGRLHTTPRGVSVGATRDVAVRLAGLDVAHTGWPRVVRLLGAPLREAFADRFVGEPIPLLLLVGEPMTMPAERRALEEVKAHAEVPIALDLSQVVRGDHASAPVLFDLASELLARGAPAVCVSAVDTYLDEARLGALVEERALKATNVDDAFVPGEGAGVLLLSALTSPPAAGPHLAHWARADEDTDELGTGVAMTRLVSAASKGGLPGLLITDLNGEQLRGREWSFVYRRVFAPAVVEGRHLGQELGDLGASTALVACAHVCAAWRAGEPAAQRALVVLHSPGRGRACVVLEASR